MSFANAVALYRTLADQALNEWLPPATSRPSRLHAAMRYSVEAGGKRVRPTLVLAAAELMGGDPREAQAAAAAVECIHTYSLIHDDLPCMDDDDLRRGRPTLHRQYDEATALLAGDALLTLAFQIIARGYQTKPTLAAYLTGVLGDAAGSERLIGGQMEDLLGEERTDLSAADLEYIHANKTGAMIAAALVMGGAVGLSGRSENFENAADLSRLRQAGEHLGLAFQITDDILDATSDAATLGKTPGKDAKADKTTFLKIHGLEKSRHLAAQETLAALNAVPDGPGDPTFLRELFSSLVQRNS